MAKTKSTKAVKSTKKSSRASSLRSVEMIDAKTESLMPRPAMMRSPLPIRKIALAIVLIGLVFLISANKGLVVAAMVNGKPVFRWQLNQVLVSRYGAQTLDQIVSESLVADEAAKAGVVVTKEEVEAKEQEVLKSVGGNVSIDELLKYQGMTRAEFQGQIRLQLTVEKLLGKDIVITDEDVANYIATNAETLTATDEAAMKEEARQAILSTKINEKLQPWFAGVKEKAKVLKFL